VNRDGFHEVLNDFFALDERVVLGTRVVEWVELITHKIFYALPFQNEEYSFSLRFPALNILDEA